MEIIIFDLDGTIANIKHRRHFLDGTTPDWERFNNLMGEDTPNVHIVELYKTLLETNKYKLVLLSGRSEKHRKITEQWLTWNNIPFDRIMMRKDKDSRADQIIKKEFLDTLIEEGKKILFVVDDRQKVVDMWRENGITCLQCDYGDF